MERVRRTFPSSQHARNADAFYAEYKALTHTPVDSNGSEESDVEFSSESIEDEEYMDEEFD